MVDVTKSRNENASPSMVYLSIILAIFLVVSIGYSAFNKSHAVNLLESNSNLRPIADDPVFAGRTTEVYYEIIDGITYFHIIAKDRYVVVADKKTVQVN